MSLRIKHHVMGVANTTDGSTNTDIATFDTTGLDNCSFTVIATITGRNTSTHEGVSAQVARSFSKASGTLTANGSGLTNVLAPVGVAALTAAVPTLDVSSATIRVRMVGVTSTTIEWTVYAEILVS